MVTILFKIMQRLVKKRPKPLNNVNRGGGNLLIFIGNMLNLQLLVDKYA